MVSGASATPESIRSGEPGPNLRVGLSGETDCAIAPFKSPASPTTRPFHSNDGEYVLFGERIVCYRESASDASTMGRRRLSSVSAAESASLAGISRELGDNGVAHLTRRRHAVALAPDVGGSQTLGEHPGDRRVEPVGGGAKPERIAQRHPKRSDHGEIGRASCRERV